MTWFKVDDTLPFHSKVVAAGNSAMGLWVRAGAWSAQMLTDGFVPDHMLTVLSGGCPEQVDALVTSGLCYRVDAGVRLHDWSDWQPSAASVLERRRQEAERKALWRAEQERKRAAERAAKQAGNEGPLSQGDTIRTESGQLWDESETSGGTDDPPTRPKPDPTRTSYGSTKGGKRGPKPKELHPLPDDWSPTDRHEAYAREHGIDLRYETFQFRNNADAKGIEMKNWNAAFSTWLGKRAKWDQQEREQGGRRLRSVTRDPETGARVEFG